MTVGTRPLWRKRLNTKFTKKRHTKGTKKSSHPLLFLVPLVPSW